jgi:hypothetical protein
MAPHASGVPRGSEAEARWRSLDRSRRRKILLKQSEPETEEEATTVLGYAWRMLERNLLFSVLGAVSAFVVWLAIAMLVQDDLIARTFIVAGSTGAAVGLGLTIGGRLRARNLEERAEESLEQWR